MGYSGSAAEKKSSSARVFAAALLVILSILEGASAADRRPVTYFRSYVSDANELHTPMQGNESNWLLAGKGAVGGDPSLLRNPTARLALARSRIREATRRGYIVQLALEPLAKRNDLADVQRFMMKETLARQGRRFREDLTQVRATLAAQKGRRVPPPEVRIQHGYSTVLHGVALFLDDEELNQVKRLPYVKEVFPDAAVSAHLVNSATLIGADQVWTSLGATGNGVVAAVIDTGIDYTHESLGGGLGPSYKVVGGYDFVNDDTNPMDDSYCSHGTHCAGILAASGSLMGVAPGAQLLAYKAIDSGGFGYTSDVIAAIERACDPDENPVTDDSADIINLSLGGLGHADNALSQVVDNAVALGVLVVASAGNSFVHEMIGSPGCARQALAVGATDKSDQIADFSSRGPALFTSDIKPEVCAPGVLITSSQIGGGTITLDGTSMAAPHVAGAAALLLELHPSWTPAQLKAALVSTAVDLGLGVMTQGAGRIDAYAAAQVEILIEPGVVNLGFVDLSLPTWSVNRILTVTNVSAGAVTYDFTLDEAELPAGVSTAITPSVSLNPGEFSTIDFQVSVDNALVPNLHEPPFVYPGYIEAHSGGNTVRVPFAFNKEQPDTLEPNNTATQAAEVTVGEKRVQVLALGRTKIDPIQPGASEPDEDWYRFTANAGQVFFAYVDAFFAGSPLAPEVELYDASLTLLESGYFISGDPRIVFYTIPVSGAYYLRVRGQGSSIGKYKLFANFLPSQVLFHWIAPEPPGGNAVSGVAFSNGGDYLYAGQHYNYLQLFCTRGNGLPLYSLSGGYKEYSEFDASENASTFIGVAGTLFCDDQQEMEIFSTPNNTPHFSQQYSCDTVYSSKVSDDGSRIMSIVSDGLRVQDSSGTVIKTIPLTVSGPSVFRSHVIRDLSRDGSLAVLYTVDLGLVVYDIENEMVRPGSYGGHYVSISDDGSRMVAGGGGDVLVWQWNGISYEYVWHRQYDPPWEQIHGDGLLLSGDGSTIALAMTHLGEAVCDQGGSYYLIDAATGELLVSCRPPKDPVVPLQTVAWEIKMNYNGSLAAFCSTGGDKSNAELIVLGRDSDEPIFELYAPGSAYSIDIKDYHIAFGIVGRHINMYLHPDDVSGALYVIDLTPPTATRYWEHYR